MNEIKKNRIKENRLNQKYRVEKKKLLEILNEEIKATEKEMEEIKNFNIKQKAIKNLKILGKTVQLIAPYILMTSITLGVNSAASRALDKNAKQYLNTKKEIDSYGNTTIEEKYGNFDNEKNIITHYSKWEKCEDVFYKRNVNVYSTTNLTEDKIEKIINDENNDISLNNVLGDPIETKVEKKNNLSHEEIMSDESLKATIYFEDKNISISTKDKNETKMLKQLITTMISAMGIISYIGIHKFRKFRNFNYKSDIEKIKEKHKSIIPSHLTLKLENQQNNYEIIENMEVSPKIKKIAKNYKRK